MFEREPVPCLKSKLVVSNGVANNSVMSVAGVTCETSGTVVGYCRVSSAGQSVDMQRDAITQRVPVTDWYSETASGKSTNRPELLRLMADVRAGKIRAVYVFRIDRLTRSGVGDTFKIIDEMRRCGVTLYSIADNVCIRPGEDITSDVMIFALSLAAKLENTARKDRVDTARGAMLARGEAFGRPKRMTPAEIETARRMASEGRTVRVIAAALGIPRSTVARAVAA